MVEQLQGGVSLDFLRQDPDFLAAPPDQQKAYLQQYVLPDLDPDFAQASPDEQNAYLDQYVLPNFIPNPTPQPLPPTQTPPPISPPAAAQMPLNKPIDPLGGYTAMGQAGAFATPYLAQGAQFGLSAGGVVPKQGVPEGLGQIPFTIGDLLGSLVSAGSGALIPGGAGLATTVGGYSALREANRQALNRGGGKQLDPTPAYQLPREQQQQLIQGVTSQGLLGALTAGLPAALGRGLAQRVATGAGLGGLQGFAQNALEQLADTKRVNLKDAIPHTLFGGVLGGGVGALGGKGRPKELASQRQELPIVRRGQPRVNLETEARLLPQPQEPTPIGRVPQQVTEAIDARATKAINRPVQKPVGRPAPAKARPVDKVDESVRRVPIETIKTDPKRFQRRADAYNEQHAARIAKDWDERKLDPLVTWRDPKNNETYVISGHHRLEAGKRAGAKDLPVKPFEGTEAEARDFATSSNTQAKTYTDLELADIVTQDIKAGKKTEEIASTLNLTPNRANRIKNLSELKGDWRTHYDRPEVKPYAQTMADAVVKHGLTELEQQQFFKFLFGQDQASKVTPTQLSELIEFTQGYKSTMPAQQGGLFDMSQFTQTSGDALADIAQKAGVLNKQLKAIKTLETQLKKARAQGTVSEKSLRLLAKELATAKGKLNTKLQGLGADITKSTSLAKQKADLAKPAEPQPAKVAEPAKAVAKAEPKPVEPTPNPVAKRMFTEERVKEAGGEYLPTTKERNRHNANIEVGIKAASAIGGQPLVTTIKTQGVIDTGAMMLSIPESTISKISPRKVRNKTLGSTHDANTKGNIGQVNLESVRLFNGQVVLNKAKATTHQSQTWLIGMDAFQGKDLLLTPEGVAVAPNGSLTTVGMQKLEWAFSPRGLEDKRPFVEIDNEIFLIDSGATSSTLPDRYLEGNTNSRQAKFATATGVYDTTIYDKTDFKIGDIQLSGLSAKKNTSGRVYYILGQDALDQLDVLIRNKPNGAKEVYIADARPRLVSEALVATEALGKQLDADPTKADLPSPPSPRQAKIDAQVERYNKALANNDPIEQGGAARMIEAELALAIKNDGMDKAGFVKATKDMPKEVFDDIAKRLNCGG